jgi:hypothetical protein
MPSRSMVARHAEGSPDAGLVNFTGGADRLVLHLAGSLVSSRLHAKILSQY